MLETKRAGLPREVFVLISAAFVIALGYGIVAPVLPTYAREFGVSIGAASAIVSSFALMRLLFAPASGQLVQKFGEKRIYLSGLAIVALSTGACALADSYWQLLFLRSLGGIGSTMFTVSAMGLLIRISPSHMRARISSLYSGSFLVGSIGGPVLGAAFASFGLRAPFVIYSLALIIACVVVATALGNSPLSEEQAQDQRPALTLRRALQLRPYRSALGANFANGWASFGVRVSLVPMFVVEAFQYSPAAAGLAMTAYAVGNAAVIIPAGRLSDRYGRRPFICAGFGVAGLATVFLGMAPELWVCLALSALAGVGTGVATPSQQAVIADVIGSRARGGQVLSTFQMVSDLGAVLGPLVIGFLADAAGYSVAFAVTGAILLSGSLLWLLTPDTRSRTETREIPIVDG
ncbi:MFS transporter [Klugiella xanthotipulae]|uniref:Putative MFS family arabinose efflux permease n=1 Tax=Klugiella xanthotipulae TaxID=244735 RepID=A0A543HSD5_9MICO|nr:MFS transporter [Klugiella xanthotipulae]TQM61247.1 putative MFS family arabinose efflux permease [Klugiella xanthotipulae]